MPLPKLFKRKLNFKKKREKLGISREDKIYYNKKDILTIDRVISSKKTLNPKIRRLQEKYQPLIDSLHSKIIFLKAKKPKNEKEATNQSKLVKIYFERLSKLKSKLNQKANYKNIEREQDRFVRHTYQLTERLLKINPSLKKPISSDIVSFTKITLAYNNYTKKNNIKNIDILTKQDVSNIFEEANKIVL